MTRSGPLGEQDIPSLLTLLQEAVVHHPVSMRRLRRDFLECPGFDPTLARVWRSPNGSVESIVAALRDPAVPDGSRACLALLATRPSFRGKGLARQLYEEVERELRQRGFREILVKGGVIPSGLDLRYTAAATALLRRLYVPTEVGYDMTLRPRQTIPAVVVPPAGYSLRLLTHEDRDVLDNLCAAEFPGWRAIVSQWVATSEHGGIMGAFDPSGNLAGFAGFDEYVFGPIGTARAYRRKGLGSALFWSAIRRIRDIAPNVPVLIGWAHFMFYARAFGCVLRGVVWRMRKDLTADPAACKGK